MIWNRGFLETGSSIPSTCVAIATSRHLAEAAIGTNRTSGHTRESVCARTLIVPSVMHFPWSTADWETAIK